jgi:GT2 family glycosyltransferase
MSVAAEHNELNLAVAIASANRAAVLHETVLSVLGQTRRPAQIILALPGPEHALPETRALPGITVVHSAMGLTRQRNRAVEELRPEIECVTFLDDDAELAPDYLAWIARLFQECPDVVMTTGIQLADGASCGGIDRANARRIVAEAIRDDSNLPDRLRLRPALPYNMYGCHMSARTSVFETFRFDERLPLYAFAEDLDFGLACARQGRLVVIENCRMVHLGTSSGRLPGARLGFSQVMNPIYLWHKGALTSNYRMARYVLKFFAANAVHACLSGLKPDRLGRLRGNFLALRSALRGRVMPEDVLEM